MRDISRCSAGSLRALVMGSLAIVLCSSAALVAAPAQAWTGTQRHTMDWGCSFDYASFNTNTKQAWTDQVSSASCSDMYVAFRTSSGGNSGFTHFPNFVGQTTGLTTYVGGWHRVCSGYQNFSS